MKRGALVISLDFELMWGIFDKVDWKEKEIYFRNTREVIPGILGMFEEYEISCTWATVGMLFNNNWSEWNNNFPDFLPLYENTGLSAYSYGNAFEDNRANELFFAPHLVREILKVPRQELATHTYSHYYCLEEGQTPEAFKADLEKNIELALKWGVKLRSLVFPRNQFNAQYLKICNDLGIRNVRSNPTDWYWKDTQKNGMLHKIYRTGDAYLGSNNKSYSFNSLQKTDNFPLSQKASRLLRPYSDNKVLNSMKLQRIFSEMTYAANHGEIYHLWWHPHNFGNNPEESLIDLKKILDHYRELKNKFGFQSMNMDEIYLNLEKCSSEKIIS